MSRGRIGLVGAGAVGPALVKLLAAAGWTVGTIASRRLRSAEAAVAFAGQGTPSTDNSAAAEGADLLVLAVPDRAIGPVATEIARSGRVAEGALVLHLSGALSSEALSPLREAGASVGSLHPLQSFADAETAAERLGGTYLFYEGDEMERIRAVAEDLEGRPVSIDPAGKLLYHAGAAAACNLAVAMVDLGIELFGAAGISRDEALSALLPLIEGTMGNVRDMGLPRALTGPVARGDVETVARHLEAIRTVLPELLLPYAAASLHAVKVGLGKGTLTEDEAEELRAMLGQAVGATSSSPKPSDGASPPLIGS